MKKKILIFLTIIFCFSIINVDASTNTYERTEEDLKLPDKVSVNDSNKSIILQTPSVNAEEKIYDFADLFTDSEEEKLFNEVNEYIKKYNLDLAIVTINENNKNSEVEYADDFYDYNDFKEDGVLFLIDMQNRQLHMTTTGDAIKMYNDYRINNALDAVYRYMSDKNYYTGTSSFINVISDYAEKGYPKENGKNEISIKQAIQYSLTGSFVVTCIVMIILVTKNKLVRKATTAEEYLNKDKKEIKKISDKFVGSNTVKHKIEHSSSGGGSSTHSGSSGISHGGGSHGF